MQQDPRAIAVRKLNEIISLRSKIVKLNAKLDDTLLELTNLDWDA